MESTVDKNSENQTVKTEDNQSSSVNENIKSKDKQEGYLTRVQSLKNLEESLKASHIIQKTLGEPKQSY